MPTLRFPTADAVRLVLASKFVPAEWTTAPTRAATDDAGRVWVAVPPGFPKDALPALGRLGVTLHGPGTGPELASVIQWAELLPLRPGDGADTGPYLVDLPEAKLAWLAARLGRHGTPPTGVRLAPVPGRAWLTADRLPLGLRLVLSDWEATVFTRRSANAWVEANFAHPLEATLTAPVGAMLLAATRGGWRVVPAAGFAAPPTAFALRPTTAPAAPVGLFPTLPTPLRLQRDAAGAGQETVWLVPDPGPVHLAGLLAHIGAQELSQFRLARVADGEARWLIFAAPRGAAAVAPTPGEAVAFTPHPGLPNLFVPAGTRLAPPLRPRTVAAAFGLTPDTLGLVRVAADGGLAMVRVPRSAFRLAANQVTYAVPAAAPLTERRPATSPLSLPRFVTEPEPSPPSFALRDDTPRVGVPTRIRPAGPGWLGRVAGNLLRRGAVPRSRAASLVSPDSPAPVRVLRKLSSTQSLVMGNEWAARRVRLEQRVMTELPRAAPARRVKLWAELADVYAAVGNPADAAVAMLNAAWADPDPPAEWFARWAAAEHKAGRFGKDHMGDAAAALAGVGSKAAAARLACAAVAHAAALPAPPPDTLARLPQLVTLIDAHAADVPARAAWLARLGVAKLSGGDPLGLARARDHLFARLADQGPGLDLDAPSFLRFRGVAAGDRFVTARDWMARIRDPIHRWLARLATPGRLQWAGLDGDPAGTTAYADLMLAWGLSKLGDRTRAADLDAQAAAVLTSPPTHGADPAVHALLLAAFRARVKAAQDGRPDPPGLPPELRADLAGLDDLGRYAVDKLRAASGILEPGEFVNPYEGRDAAGFLGADALGERLTRFLAGRPALPRPEDARQLLALDAADPTAATMPRIIYALLEMAPHLDPQLVAAVIPETVRAVELIPEWVRIGSPYNDPTAAASRFGRRMLEAACHAATQFHLVDSFRLATEELIERCDTPDGPAARLVESVAGRYFRTLRRLGLNPLAALLLGRLRAGTAAGPRELGLAVGRFAAGDDDGGNRVLDAARERLFVKGIGDDRERTDTAVAYAVALGHAPPRIALGRLEELFLRLDMVAATGATNRYYTLPPLKLIDTVVRAVVSDDFAVGPGVRGWLDDDEFAIWSKVARDLAAALAAGA